MRTFLFCLLLVAALTSSLGAGLVRIGTIPTPHRTIDLSGLDADGDLLFAVAESLDHSAMYLIDRTTGEIVREVTVTDSIPLCPGQRLRFLSCAVEPSIPAPYYWVGDQCGALIKYTWSGDEVDTVTSFVPFNCAIPDGLIFSDIYLYMLDSQMSRILKLDPNTGYPIETIYIEQGMPAPLALSIHDGSFYVIGAGTDWLYNIGDWGYIEDAYELGDFDDMTARGLTFFGDTIYVAVPDTLIYIYCLGYFGDDVPGGDSVVVDVIPDEVSVEFDTVATAGSLYVEVQGEQPCPPPEGVSFFSSFYEMGTSASFDYTAQVSLMMENGFPSQVDAKDVRVFVRPSGECETWRDITVAAAEEIMPTSEHIRTLMRTQSEEDEFSVFVLGADRRNPGLVADLKFGYLEEALASHESDIPGETYEILSNLLNQAHNAFLTKRIRRAILLIEAFARRVEDTPEIPHTYDPGGGTENVAGKLLSRAHTLIFTLNLLVEKHAIGEGMPGKEDSPTLPDVHSNLTVGILANPQVGGATIRLYGRPGESVSLRIYSVEGELVRTLLETQSLMGPCMVTWDGIDDAGSRAAAGTYFVVARQGSEVSTAKIVLRR